MILYHASTLCIVKPDVLHSRDKLDFGKGFYLTAFLEQAVRYAERFTQRGKDAFINEYELDDATPGFIVKSFPQSRDAERLAWSSANEQIDVALVVAWLDFREVAEIGDAGKPLGKHRRLEPRNF